MMNPGKKAWRRLVKGKKAWVFLQIGERESAELLLDWLREDPFLRPPRGRSGSDLSGVAPNSERQAREIWGLREGKELRGCLFLDLYPRVRGAEVTVVVDPGFRRRGAGRFLLKEARLRAIALELAFLEVSVDLENRGSVLLFEGQGFILGEGAVPGMRKLRLQLEGKA